jgi:hypothetical protein
MTTSRSARATIRTIAVIVAIGLSAIALPAQSAVPAAAKYANVAADLERFIIEQLREHRIP